MASDAFVTVSANADEAEEFISVINRLFLLPDVSDRLSQVSDTLADILSDEQCFLLVSETRPASGAGVTINIGLTDFGRELRAAALAGVDQFCDFLRKIAHSRTLSEK